MKKIFIVLSLILLMTGCSSAPKSDPCDFLINATWEGTDSQCTNYLSFNEDMSINNRCACGDYIGYPDITDHFIYSEEERAVKLYDAEGEYMLDGKILFNDDIYLVINIWNNTYVYENMDCDYIPQVHTVAQDEVYSSFVTMPCVSILDFEDGILTVASHDYDGDAEGDFETWQIPVIEDVKCRSIDVTVINDNATKEVTYLSAEDLDRIGEDYTYGYLEFSPRGDVVRITFYGETVTQDSTL
ncbi:MAG: hypothetical protein IKT62_01530 [Firmicutes bacterium]|nr:hypothetical protein [Bacillota bacterium]